MERWEHEIVELKEAKGGYDADKIGCYFFEISNEANLRNQQYDWLVFAQSFEKLVLMAQAREGEQDGTV